MTLPLFTALGPKNHGVTSIFHARHRSGRKAKIQINMLKTKKAQAWIADFAIAIIIFAVVLVSYYTYTTNVSKHDAAILNDLVSDAKSVSSSLLLSGYPNDWDNATVQIIGITDNNNKISQNKLANLKDISFNNAKSLLGTIYDFFLFFEDSNGTLVNIGNRCGYGSPEVKANTTYRKTAYYSSDDDYMSDEIAEIENEFGVTIDKNWQNENDFTSNLGNYYVAIMENPKLGSQGATRVQDYVYNGGIVFISKRALNGNSGSILGVTYTKRTSCSIDQSNNYWTKIISKDLFLDLDVGKSFEAQGSQECSYISGPVNKLAEYNGSTTAIAAWDYGNGVAYYLSDFNMQGYDIQDKAKEAIKARIMKCGKSDSVNVTASYGSLIRTDRILAYNSKPVKMVLYLWQ